MNKKLIIIDLDGTTLDSFTTINKKNVEVIKKVRKLGHIVCIATGRPFRSSKQYYSILELDTLIANFNGTHIIHPYDENFEDVLLTIDAEPIRNLMKSEIMNQHVINAFCEYGNDVYLHHDDPDFHEFLLKTDDTVIINGHLSELTVSPNSMVLKFDEDYVDEVFAELNKFPTLSYRRWTGEGYTAFIEVYNKHYNKATALSYIGEYYNITIEDTIAIGDEHNDIEMVQAAGLGVCVNNATQKLKDVADLILDKKNTEGAVGHFLEEYFKL